MTRYSPGLMTVLLACVVLIGGARSAMAEYAIEFGKLFCEGNRALILFGTGSNNRMPDFPDAPSGFPSFTNPPVEGSDCVLSDGREVRVKMGNKELRGYGECGSGPESWTSLWVDHKRVISRSEVLNDCRPLKERLADIYLLDDGVLTICLSEKAYDGWAEPIITPQCRNASDLLTTAAEDPVEYPTNPDDVPKVGEVTMKFAENVDFCERFITRDGLATGIVDSSLGGSPHDPRYFMPSRYADVLGENLEAWWPNRDYIVLPHDAVRVSFSPLIDRLPHARDQDRFVLESEYSIADFDFDNDGLDDVVLRESHQSSLFDGDRFFVRNRHDAMAALKALDDDMGIGVEHEAYDLRTEIVRMFGGTEDDGSRHQSVFRLGGRTLVFATGFIGISGFGIYRPHPGGVEEPVCIFERRPENY